MANDQQQSNIKQETNIAQTGLNLDQSVNQITKGKLTYALNASVENYDANSVNYQNEPGNELCLKFPEGFKLIGTHFINEKSKHIFFLVNPETGGSEIGYMDNNDCVYRKFINDPCLNFNINHPILKVVHKITNCSIEVYWTDGYNPRRFVDLNKIPYKKIIGGLNDCDITTTSDIDCNKLSVQPNFDIPQLKVIKVQHGGQLTAGTVQFAIQYCDSAGDGYTSYYSVTNPTPIADPHLISNDFNYPVGKSVVLDISNIDTTGYFQYFNVAVIKTVNAIPAVELVGTYFIDKANKQITYNGQNQTLIKLTVDDIFEKFPYYEIAKDVTAVQDILVWDDLISVDRINYQSIANKIRLQWETWRIPATENYSDEINATNLRGYLRDEVYPFEIVFLLAGGKQTDGFHIPGREISTQDKSHPDVVSTSEDYTSTGPTSPYWKIYNTATVNETDANYTTDPNYKGPYQSGEFSYWESTETYPCDDSIWGELAGQPIRHHKFPDVNISPIFENPTPQIGPDNKYINLEMGPRAIYPIGVKINIEQIKQLILYSSLTQAQKDAIVGFKIVRGDRNTNQSIVAKGILRNVGKYTREGTDYYFPNYPYNDLNEDPFLLTKPNAYNSECNSYNIQPSSDGQYQYTDCYTNKPVIGTMYNGQMVTVCSLTKPVILSGTIAGQNIIPFNTYVVTSVGGNVSIQYANPVDGIIIRKTFPEGRHLLQSRTGGFPEPKVLRSDTGIYSIIQTSEIVNTLCYPDHLNAFTTDDSKLRHVFNSPETSFTQPFLGSVLKLESAIFGKGKGHFVEVKKNAMYKLLTKEAQQDALKSSENIAAITSPFNATAMFTAFQAYVTIYINGITRRNYGYSYNSIADYNYSAPIDNTGNKQRVIDLKQYLIPVVQSAGDQHNINNYQRESSVYVKTEFPLPFPNEIPSLTIGTNLRLIEDKSRFINSQKDCSKPENEFDISVVSYYASLKNQIDNQWGQIYSYETIDTGYQMIFKDNITPDTDVFFGGDTFIGRFSFKTKLPFFIDNRVGAVDDSDIFYDEIGNIAYPEYWHSARSVLFDYKTTGGITFKNLISTKAHYFDCPNNQLPAPDNTVTPAVINPNRTFYDGKMYMFAYGIPTFYCESSINVDLRQAVNSREGEFYPHVSTGIPDDWMQQSFVPIVQDNTYFYNTTFSKQNKENFFSHLPANWKEELCYTNFPFRAIYSDRQQSFTDNRINSWLIYRPISFFDFPQNYGKLTALDGIQNRAILARFENKSLLYNTLLTIDTSNPKAAYMGNDSLFKSSPPVDFADTDLGFVGSQHKFLLKIPQGQITVDAKRGQVFLISGNSVTDLSRFGSGLNRFFTDHLAFEILRYFPNVDVDNHYKGLGLHGVYDSKFDRVIISKLDYIPLSEEIKYDEVEQKFYVNNIFGNRTIKNFISLSDTDYFCNKSWTLSYNMNTQSWISFHSYIPNWYIAENNFFYSGLNESCDLEFIAVTEGDCSLPIGQAIPLQCQLFGQAILPDCLLVGQAILETTTTTSTSSTSTTTSTSTSTTTTTTTTAAPTTTTTTTTVAPTTTTTTTTAPPTTTTTTTQIPLSLQANLTPFTAMTYDVTMASTVFNLSNIITSASGTNPYVTNVATNVLKTSNTGHAADNVVINYYKNGGLVHSESVLSGAIVNVSYTLTGVSPGDLIFIDIYEG